MFNDYDEKVFCRHKKAVAYMISQQLNNLYKIVPDKDSQNHNMKRKWNSNPN